ncbi:MAG: MotA/TolQ/ExbB proton channel family protein, partial [Pirellulales bacterium]|nr:MotA/TolQ/ExbB proton channel family protein [Pirellulales bacterium]
MYFKFACPSCGKNLKAREEHVGRRVGCPYCHTSVTVSAPSESPEPSAPAFPGIDTGGGDAGTTRQTTQRPTRPPAAPRSRPAKKSTANWSQGSDVNMLVSSAIALAISVAFFVVMLPLQKQYLGELFLERGWIPYVLVFLLAWSLVILTFKWRQLAKQKATMLFDLIPTEIDDEITVDNLDKFIDHVRSLPVAPGSSFLIDRVRRGLEHFRIRKSSAEVASVLTSQSEIDATAVDSSYTLLKVFIWAIPILGFIGTVIGISAAVGGFSGSLDAAEDVSVLKESLNGVTSGLATAFDTTLIALVMSLAVMFPTSSLQKMEEDLLNWVDEYCNENLLKRL